MIGILEINHLPVYLLHILAATLLVARLLHGYALSFTDSFTLVAFGARCLRSSYFLLRVCCAYIRLPSRTFYRHKAPDYSFKGKLNRSDLIPLHSGVRPAINGMAVHAWKSRLYL